MTLPANLELIITGPDTELVFPLAIGVSIVGRVPGVDIQLDHPRILRRHIRIVVSETEIQITPLSRRSRTQVNDEEIPAEIPAKIELGDRISVGPFMLMIMAAEVEETATQQAALLVEDESELVSTNGNAPPPTAMPDYLRQAPLPPTDYSDQIPDGLGRHSIKYMRYLPHIFHDDFTSRFMGLIEALFFPMQWNVDNFDLFLDPATAPPHFLDWIAGWFGLKFDHTWSIEQRRTLLAEANDLFSQRGTKRALARLLEIYTGRTPEIDDIQPDLAPFTFIIRLPMRERDINRTLIEQLIEANKPSHTSYNLEFSGQLDLDVVYSKLDFGD